MFGVGLHFSLKDLLSVRAIAVPGALAQGLVATPLGMALGWLLGWPLGAGIIFGIALVGGEHRGAVARVAGASAARDRARADHRRLADRAGHRHGAGAGAAAGPSRAVSRRGDGAGDGRGGALGRHGSRQVRHFHRRHADRRQESSSRRSCIMSPIPAAASCSGLPCCPSRSASLTPRPSYSASRSRSARSSPA